MTWRRAGVPALCASLLGACVLAWSGATAVATTGPADGGPRPGRVLEATLSRACGPGQAWIAGSEGGATCLDTGGWTTFSGGYGSFPGGNVADVVVCRDGTAWMASLGGLVSQKGRTWRAHPATRSRVFDSLACDAKKGVWAAAYKGVHYYDGAKLRTWPASKLGTGPFVDLVKDVAVGPDGHVWVATANSIATFDGSRWTWFEKGQGFDEEHFFEAVVVDTQGRVWAGTSSTGLLAYDGSAWTTFDERFLFSVESLAVDPAGRVWVGTHGRGLSVWDGSTWTTYDASTSPLPDAGIPALAADGRGRIWVGTDFGLAVLDGADWTVYHMHDSGLAADEIRAIAVAAKGPSLPAPKEKKPGSMKGRIVRSGSAVADIPVEVCAARLGPLYTGKTPCAGKPLVHVGRTDASGRFSFAGLPVGRYAITWLPAGGKWTTLSTAFGIGSSRRLVSPGKVTDVGTIDLAKGD